MHATALITNGGPHPSDKWAAVTADHICRLIEIDESSVTPEAIAARKAKPRFELALADALDGHHATVQDHEKGALVEHGVDRYGHPLDPQAQHMDEALAAVLAVAKGTPFEDGVASDEFQAAVLAILGSHFATSIDIERKWHRDRARASA